MSSLLDKGKQYSPRFGMFGFLSGVPLKNEIDNTDADESDSGLFKILIIDGKVRSPHLC